MEERLSKELDLIDCVGLGVGTMIGGTIYAALGLAMRITNGAADIAFLVASAVALLVAYIYSKISSEYPDSGGSYSIVSLGLGRRMGVAVGFIQLFAYTVASAFYAWVFVDYLYILLPIPKILSCLALLLFLTVIVASGAKEAGRFEVIITAGKVIILLFIASTAITVVGIKLPSLKINIDILKASGLIFLGFEGFEVISSASAETRNPDRDIKVSMAISIILVALIYMALAIAARGIGKVSEDTAVADIARSILGEKGLILVLTGSLLSTVSASNASLYVASRLLYTMARDGYLPKPLTKTWRRNSPWVSAIISGIAAVFLALSGTTITLMGLSSIAFIALFTMVSLSGLRLIRRKYIPILALIGLLTLAFSALLIPPNLR